MTCVFRTRSTDKLVFIITMLEEPGISPADPPKDRHRPPGTTSGDISHVLESIFKDLYSKDIMGKDTSNLIKKGGGGSSYHEKYVEELQQVHSEYARRIKEVDMLESHIIQARAQAAATEKQAYERIEESIDDRQGLRTVESAFSCCVDNDLLKRNNLIAPQDYIPSQKSRREAPAAAIKVNPTKPTIAYAMHVSREPQDDGYTLIRSPEKHLPETSELDFSLTLEPSSDTSKQKTVPKQSPNQTKPRPKWIGGLNAKERAEVLDKIQKMKQRHNFLRNPRFLPPITHQGGTSLQPRTDVGKTHPAADPPSIFLAKPSVLVFSDYMVGHIYETTLELKNMTSASRQVRVIPPTTSYFSIGLGRFPGEGGIVAPGMSCKYSVRFAPDSLGEFEDFILVETQMEQALVVPIVAKRLPPVLTLPRVLDCGYCLIGGVKFVEFHCQNVGLSAGTFCIIPKNQWPLSNLRSVGRTCFIEQPPFAVSPSVFALQPGEATVVEVVFFPTATERSCQVFTIVCDNCQVKDIAVEAEGQMLALELMSVSGQTEPPVVGEEHDLTAEHFIRFSPSNPHAVQQKKIIIRNNVHLELPFHWQIMKPNLQPLLPGDSPEPSRIQFHLATDDVFHVSPPAGVLAPCQEEEFLFTFCPKELKDYHSVCHLVLKDIPQLPPETCDNGVLQPVRPRSKVSEVIAMEIEVKGSTEPYQVLLEPYDIVIPGEVFIFTSTRRQFKMWNHSKSCISFRWERMSSSHIIDVEPSTGRIEENECFDFELIVTGEKPGKVVTAVLCHIEHHHEPVTLAVEVSFKGPIVTIGVPSVDFGLLKLGEQTQSTLLLTNITQLEASWKLRERQDHRGTQIIAEPSQGVLAPLASCSVRVLFMPRFSQHYESELELTVEHGTGCYLSVRADVQSPQVCLLNCELLLSELYVGVPAKSTVTLFNQTLLPAHFSWMAQLKGKHAELCAASFDPSSGTLGPNASMEVTVNFIPHTDAELTEVVALCEVQGMNSPLVLSILVSKTKKLSMSYSLPGVSSAPGDEIASTPLLLDFGDDVILKRAVTKQFLITNQSAIPAPFTIETEYFTCHASKPNNKTENKFAYVRKPLHSIQAKKLEEKAREEFVNSLLAHGKGAAFFVSPCTGTLGPFQAQTVDVTAYADMWGEYRDRLVCKVGDLQPALIPVQMEVKGCPLYFQMTGPRPDGRNLGPLIRFGTHVSGGDTVSRALRINNPSMFDIRLDWESYNFDPNDCKLVDMRVSYREASPLKDADGSVASRSVFPGGSAQTDGDRNVSPDSEGSSDSSRIASGEEGAESASEEVCQEEEARPDPLPAEQKLLSGHIGAQLGNPEDYPYCVTPQQIVIPAKGCGTVHVSFTPLTLSGSVCESRCVGLALGVMSLDSEAASCVPGKVVRAHGLDVEPVRVDLLAVVKPAGLVVQMEEDEGVLEFHASAGDLLKGESDEELRVQDFDVVQTFQLRNNSEMVLQFTLGTQPPFVVVGPQPRARTGNSSNPSTGESQSLVLQPQHNMQVKVAFRCSLSLLDHVDQSAEGVPAGVTLVHKSEGQRKLKFEQNLRIHHSNNSLQTVPLCALLDLPTMRLSADSIDFGSCYSGQTRTVAVSLCSLGASTSWKSHIESDEGVFSVTPDSGCLKSKELHFTSCSQCLDISFTPSEARQFEAKVLIRSPLLKTALTLQLQGTGSFDEMHRSHTAHM